MFHQLSGRLTLTPTARSVGSLCHALPVHFVDKSAQTWQVAAAVSNWVAHTMQGQSVLKAKLLDDFRWEVRSCTATMMDLQLP